MGVLYYVAREGDNELFALNKVYRYAAGLMEWEDPRPLPSFAEFGSVFNDHFEDESRPRMHARLQRWASGRRVWVVSEHHFDRVGQELGPITGSAFDSDYENDGVTYRPGSAW